MIRDRPEDETPRRAADWPEVALALGLVAGLVLLFTVDVGGAAPQEEARDLFEGMLRTVIGYVASGAEVVAGLVIA